MQPPPERYRRLPLTSAILFSAPISTSLAAYDPEVAPHDWFPFCDQSVLSKVDTLTEEFGESEAPEKKKKKQNAKLFLTAVDFFVFFLFFFAIGSVRRVCVSVVTSPISSFFNFISIEYLSPFTFIIILSFFLPHPQSELYSEDRDPPSPFARAVRGAAIATAPAEQPQMRDARWNTDTDPATRGLSTFLPANDVDDCIAVLWLGEMLRCGRCASPRAPGCRCVSRD